uniref:Carboxylesterase type B domain-containing protein n=1 Tax=Acrobeloides nanus TaxID=290746 RepID=A0A914EFU7_9BILA
MSDQLWIPAIEQGRVNETDFAIANTFGEFWTNFAKYGTPSLANEWARTNTTNVKLYYEIGQSRGNRLGYRILDQYVWNQVLLDLVFLCENSIF